ncbi:MAG: hypothetical protein KVP17_000578 [Porospora cf. gigantea B]|uniref:uncharacterized protein n=1 Tax=Porospora cf. gigantea B TaxID=2853592 RepID=UPI003571C112|nr:MAG: hypothetical protein KVP17_000578 [Porospora cf. gigantea B]
MKCDQKEKRPDTDLALIASIASPTAYGPTEFGTGRESPTIYRSVLHFNIEPPPPPPPANSELPLNSSLPPPPDFDEMPPPPDFDELPPPPDFDEMPQYVVVNHPPPHISDNELPPPSIEQVEEVRHQIIVRPSNLPPPAEHVEEVRQQTAVRPSNLLLAEEVRQKITAVRPSNLSLADVIKQQRTTPEHLGTGLYGLNKVENVEEPEGPPDVSTLSYEEVEVLAGDQTDLTRMLAAKAERRRRQHERRQQERQKNQQ